MRKQDVISQDFLKTDLIVTYTSKLTEKKLGFERS